MNPAVLVAQPGWNATTAPDWALVFSSKWPSLQIAFEKTMTIPAGQLSGFSVNHNLGYVPLASVWISTPDFNYGRINEIALSTTSIQSTYEQIVFDVDLTITIRCYNIDITKEASYPLPIAAAAKTAPDLTTGIKIVKQNPTRGIHSKNLNDFILDSQAQSPAILDVATQASQYAQTKTIPYSITYPLQTAYIPWVTGAVSQEGTYLYYSPTALSFDASTNSIVLKFGEVGNIASLIVLRDPLFYPNVVRVVY